LLFLRSIVLSSSENVLLKWSQSTKRSPLMI
jgi:hypothetical protein